MSRHQRPMSPIHPGSAGESAPSRQRRGRTVASKPAPATETPTAGSSERAANDTPLEGQRRVFKEPRSVLEAFLVSVVRLAGARGGAVRALTADSDEPRLVAAWGVSAESLEDTLEPCDRCADESGAQAPSGCKRTGDPLLGEACAGTFAIPLEYKGRSVGVFTLFFDEVNSLRPEVIHLLRPVGQFVGLALENAKLEREKLQSRLTQERQSMAGEIHDSLAQSLTFVRMRMPLLADAIERKDLSRAAKYCGDVNGELGSVNRRLRELVTHFRAGMDAQGLESALEATARSFFDECGIRLTLQNEVAGLALGAEREVQVFRIVQEALANVRKHSHARHARVRLVRVGRELRVTIEDDGAGIPEGACAEGESASGKGCGHFGIEIMRERAEVLGGRLEIRNSASGGLIVTLVVPAQA